MSALLTAILLALCPLAHATPIDPTWMAGLYDGADHDDAVLAITDTVISPLEVFALEPAALSSVSLVVFAPAKLGKPTRIRLADRAPPLS